MSLLSEIREAATGSNVDIVVLLRKCKVLAAKLGNKEFSLWVEHELNGYPSRQELPDYRITDVESFGNFVGIGWSQWNRAPIAPSALPEEYRDMITKDYRLNPISYYASLMGEKRGSEPLAINWPHDLTRYFSGKIYSGWTCTQAWKQLTVGSIVNLVDTVINKILEFVITLEAEAPDAGEAPPNSEPIPMDKVNKLVSNIFIMGNVGNLAAGVDQTITHNTIVTVTENDLESLRQFLTDIGLTEEDILELEESIRKDEQGFRDNVQTWLSKAIIKVGTGAKAIGVSVAAHLITKAIELYLGM